jgi:hypothetical protein
MVRLFHLLLSILFLLFAKQNLAQAPDTVRPGRGGLDTRYLKPGVRQYLVCYLDAQNNRRMRFWYWVRDIARADDVFTITQRWYGDDTVAFRKVYSVNAAKDFAPVYHSELVQGKLNAYNWMAGEITGADTVEGNTRKGFHLAFTEPNYNWNLDVETFEMLPLGKGKVFLINFYDAGQGEPKYVRYEVKGEERLTLLDGQQTDCWKLQTEGTEKGVIYLEMYWISKKGHQFLKEEDHYSGMVRYKIRMPDMASDVREVLSLSKRKD